MKRILVLSAENDGLDLASAEGEVVRRALPPADAPAEDWDDLVAALLAADVVITE